MDLDLKKQWEHQQQPQQQDVGSEDQQEPKVLPPLTHPQLNTNTIILHKNNDNKEDHLLPSCSSAGSTLPLFVPDHPTPPHQQPPSKTQTYPWTWSHFSVAQWQELELQALIYRYLLSGAAVPSELLHPIKKSLAHQSPSFFHHDHHHQLQPHLECFLHHPQSQPFRFQAGYWGSASMDPEPGRCRRTDGKKWRCSRDVVLGQKYCERHVHRGRNRSRKPVEIPPTLRTHATASATGGSIGVVTGSSLKTNPDSVTVAATGASRFALSGPAARSPVNLFQMNRSHSGPTTEFMTQNESSGGQVLRHFFDDWPRPVQNPDPDVLSLTGLSMPTVGNSSSDVSLKLSTGDVEPSAAVDDLKREQTQGSNRSVGWWPNRVASMGGPLAEALQSSAAPNYSSPRSVLHQLTCGLGSGTSLITQV